MASRLKRRTIACSTSRAGWRSSRVAIVTGGNGGIGLGMARGLARAGARVVVAARDEAKSKDAVKELEALGPGAGAVTTGVTDEAAGRGLVPGALGTFRPADHPVHQRRP